MENSGYRTPLGDKTNTTNGAKNNKTWDIMLLIQSITYNINGNYSIYMDEILQATMIRETMLENVREKKTRLGGSTCLKRRRMKEIENDEKHIKEQGSNDYMSKLTMVD
jgi:hypothetical protein